MIQHAVVGHLLGDIEGEPDLKLVFVLESDTGVACLDPISSGTGALPGLTHLSRFLCVRHGEVRTGLTFPDGA